MEKNIETRLIFALMSIIAALVFGILNLINVISDIGWATLIPWEYYKSSFETSNYLLINLMCFVFYAVFMPRLPSFNTWDGTVFLLTIACVIVALVLYWSPMFLLFMGTYTLLYLVYYVLKATKE
jgi:hypothetical protein